MSSTHRHFIIHKPHGYLSQFVYNQRQRRNKKKLGDLYDFPEGTMSIGRLDQNSEGLLLLTTDGKVSEEVRSKKVEKEYYAQVDGLITDEAIEQLQNGVMIKLPKGNLYETLPCSAARLKERPSFHKEIRDERHGPTSWISITIREGKFRQVRKMTAAVGFPTLRLVRIRIGQIQMDQLQPGKVWEVDEFQLTS